MGTGFRTLPDLAVRTLGGSVVWATDESFAERQNLILARPPTFDADSFGHRGKVYDGWETARRRDAGNDWVSVQLAGEGRVRLADLDTSYFLYNAPGWATLRGRGSGDWAELLPRTRLQPDTRHRFLLADAPPAIEVRLDIYPDGGLARLRLFGELTDTGRRDVRLGWSAAAP